MSIRSADADESAPDLIAALNVETKGKGKYYLTNQDLLPAVIDAKSKGFLTDKLARMLMLLTDRYSRRSNFSGYSFREDMVSSALTNLCQNALKFDPEKSSNPFAFYTTAIHNSFLQYMMGEKKHRYIRDTLLIQAGCDASFTFMNDGNKSGSSMSSDDIVVTDEVPTEVDEKSVYKPKINEIKSAKPAKAVKPITKKEKKKILENKVVSF